MRGSVNKRSSGKRFDRRSGKTASMNKMNPRRGGIRL